VYFKGDLSFYYVFPCVCFFDSSHLLNGYVLSITVLQSWVSSSIIHWPYIYIALRKWILPSPLNKMGVVKEKRDNEGLLLALGMCTPWRQYQYLILADIHSPSV